MATQSTQPKPAATKRLVSIDDAAEQLGLSPHTLRNWTRDGKIASHKLGARRMLSQETIDQLIVGSLQAAQPMQDPPLEKTA